MNGIVSKNSIPLIFLDLLDSRFQALKAELELETNRPNYVISTLGLDDYIKYAYYQAKPKLEPSCPLATIVNCRTASRIRRIDLEPLAESSEMASVK